MRALTFTFMFLLLGSSASAGTIEDVKARGVVTCAVEDASPGISQLHGAVRKGLAVDLCAAIAAAVLGNAEAVAFVVVTDADAFSALQAEEADVLLMARPWRFADEVEQGVLLVQPLLENRDRKSVFGPIVRQGDDAWFVALRWLLLAMASENGVRDLSQTAIALGFHQSLEAKSMRYDDILNRNMNNIKAQGFHPAPVPNLANWN